MEDDSGESMEPMEEQGPLMSELKRYSACLRG